MNGPVPQLKVICAQNIFNNRVHDVSFLQHAKAVTIVLANLSKQPDPVQTLLYFSSNIPKFVKTLDFNNTKLNNNGLALLKRKI
jgi:hypothetical protein